MIRNEGVRIAPWLRSMLLASVLNLGMPDARTRPRGDRFYRPPAAAPLSLQPNGHFQPPQWLKLVGPGCHWLGLDVPSTATAYGVIVGAMGTHGELWYTREVTANAINVTSYVLSHPGARAPPLFWH